MDIINQLIDKINQISDPTIVYIVGAGLFLIFVLFIRSILQLIMIFAVISLLFFGWTYISGGTLPKLDLKNISFSFESSSGSSSGSSSDSPDILRKIADFFADFSISDKIKESLKELDFKKSSDDSS
ncbi:hypothetical protein N9W34_03080 [Rickettsiales bacterium]|nr:hypothetical protein [Rickettsiales bacterium]